MGNGQGIERNGGALLSPPAALVSASLAEAATCLETSLNAPPPPPLLPSFSSYFLMDSYKALTLPHALLPYPRVS